MTYMPTYLFKLFEDSCESAGYLFDKDFFKTPKVKIMIFSSAFFSNVKDEDLRSFLNDFSEYYGYLADKKDYVRCQCLNVVFVEHFYPIFKNNPDYWEAMKNIDSVKNFLAIRDTLSPDQVLDVNHSRLLINTCTFIEYIIEKNLSPESLDIACNLAYDIFLQLNDLYDIDSPYIKLFMIMCGEFKELRCDKERLDSRKLLFLCKSLRLLLQS
jgi:hypothetical protein